MPNINRIRVLLSVEQRIWKELLEFSFDSRTDMDIVGETTNPIECLALIVQAQPNIWIHSMAAGSDLDDLQSRAFELSPDLMILRLDPQENMGQLLLQVNSITDILTIAAAKLPASATSFSS